ncbi:MAG TPA: AAC(3) family N-acetyltransferase [Mobilitalea sp.]|nr:AAC(3) family N-acetyltransferase [Mobilitalea sp.]
MSINSVKLTDQFRRIGLKPGDTVLVHSSLRSFGYVEGGALTVIEALMNTISDKGTLIVPTLTGRREDSAACPPVFDVFRTKCWTGTIPETLRNMEGALRSLHPTHSVTAIGSQKEFVTSEHEKSLSPCDKQSPYYKNAQSKGYIMLAGVDQESNTSIHSCEEIAGVPYHLQQNAFEINITGYDGKEITVINRLHNWEKPATDFNKLDQLFEMNGIMKKYKVGNSLIRLINAYEMFEFTIDILINNPYFLLV